MSLICNLLSHQILNQGKQLFPISYIPSRNLKWKLRNIYKRSDTPSPDADLLWRSIGRPDATHPEQSYYPGEYDIEFPYGKIYKKNPFKMTLEAGKEYKYCTCGESKSQPLCDGRHRIIEGTSFRKYYPKFRPISFNVEKTDDYWLCNCKQSTKRPFCDGTHKSDEVQDMKTSALS